MEKSKVFFTDLRTVPGNDLLKKLEKLIRRAGIGEIDFDRKYAAIKIHFGEPGNLAYLRPNYAKAVADVIKELGGKPFLTDCNTLYVGGRKNALDHMESAYENGYSPFSTSSPNRSQRMRLKYSCLGYDKKLRESVSIPTNPAR